VKKRSSRQILCSPTHTESTRTGIIVIYTLHGVVLSRPPEILSQSTMSLLSTPLNNWTRKIQQSPSSEDLKLNKWEDATQTENRVSYDADSFFGMLFRFSGTVWPKVLPYCIVNVALTCIILVCKRHWKDYTFPDNGHSFMGLALSFFLVNRANYIYARYMDQRGELEALLRSSKEMIHCSCIFSRLDKVRHIVALYVAQANIEANTEKYTAMSYAYPVRCICSICRAKGQSNGEAKLHTVRLFC
jgi:hypothetical protein